MFDGVPHDSGFGFDPGPVLHADDSLVDDHAEAIDGATATGLGVAEQAGEGWVEDDIGDDHVGEQRGGVEGEPGVGIVETDGCAIDDYVGAWGNAIVAIPGDELGGEVESFAKDGEQCGGAVGRAVDEREVGDTGEGEFDGDGPGGPAGTEQHNPFALGIEHFAERAEEAFAIGVLADELLAPADHAVDGPHQFGRGAQAVEVRDDGDLVGQAAVEAAKAEGAGPADGITQQFGGDLAVDVAEGEAVVTEGGFHHVDGRIAGGPDRETANEFVEKAAGVGHGRAMQVGEEAKAAASSGQGVAGRGRHSTFDRGGTLNEAS